MNFAKYRVRGAFASMRNIYQSRELQELLPDELLRELSSACEHLSDALALWPSTIHEGDK